MFNTGLHTVYKHFFWDYKLRIALLFISFIIIFFIFYLFQAVNAYYSYFYSVKTGFVPSIAVIEHNAGAKTLSENVYRQLIQAPSLVHYKIGEMYEIKNCRINYGESESQGENIIFMAVSFPSASAELNVRQNGRKQVCAISNLYEFGRMRIEVSNCILNDGLAEIITQKENIKVNVSGHTLIYDSENKNNAENRNFYALLSNIMSKYVDINSTGIYFDRFVRPHDETMGNDDLYNVLVYIKRPIMAYLSIIFNNKPNYEQMIYALASNTINDAISKYEGLTTARIIDERGTEYPVILQDVFQNDAEFYLPKNVLLVNYDAFQLFAPQLRDKGQKFIFLYFRDKDAALKETLSIKSRGLDGVDVITKEDMTPTFSKQFQYVTWGIKVLKYSFAIIVLIITIILLLNFYNNYHKELYLMKIYGLSLPFYTIILTIIALLSGTVSLFIVKNFYLTINTILLSYYYPAMKFNLHEYYPSIYYCLIVLSISFICEIYLIKRVIVKR